MYLLAVEDDDTDGASIIEDREGLVEQLNIEKQLYLLNCLYMHWLVLIVSKPWDRVVTKCQEHCFCLLIKGVLSWMVGGKEVGLYFGINSCTQGDCCQWKWVKLWGDL